MVSSPLFSSSIQYDAKTIQRAEKALCCVPFDLGLFRAMVVESVPLPLIADRSGVDRGYTNRPLSERQVEIQLLWLIQVGLLRREVDGQGITDSFRLTPLGRQIIHRWQGQTALPSVSVCDRVRNRLGRSIKII